VMVRIIVCMSPSNRAPVGRARRAAPSLKPACVQRHHKRNRLYGRAKLKSGNMRLPSSVTLLKRLLGSSMISQELLQVSNGLGHIGTINSALLDSPKRLRKTKG
jgi:hypothetical protein